VKQPTSSRYKGRPHISLDALTDVCYAAASRDESALRFLLKRALWEYSGKDMQWHAEYLEAVVADVVGFARDAEARSLRELELEDEASSG